MTALASDLLSTFAHAVMVGCGLIFLVASLEKIRHREILSGVIANYRILPAPLVPLAAGTLPPFECLLGMALLFRLTSFAAAAGAALLLTFAAAMAVNIARGRNHIHCGCGRAELQQELRWSLVARNIVLAAALALSAAFAAPLGLVDQASALFAGLALFIANRLFEAIGALNTTSRIR